METDQTNTTLDLAVVRQQLTELAHAQVTLEQVEANLTPVYNAAVEAGDENTQILLTQAWNSAVAIAEHANQAMALAEGLTTTAEGFRQQRDVVATEHDNLVKAIEQHDYAHPVVSEFYSDVQDEVWETAMDSGCYLSNCPACDMTENHSHPFMSGKLTHNVAEAFFDLLMNDHDEQLTDDFAEELVGFIIQFVRKVADSQKAQADDE